MQIVKILSVIGSFGEDFILELDLSGQEIEQKIRLKGKTISELSDIIALSDGWMPEDLRGSYVKVWTKNKKIVKIGHVTDVHTIKV